MAESKKDRKCLVLSRKARDTQNALFETPGGSAAFTDLNNFHSEPTPVQSYISYRRLLGMWKYWEMWNMYICKAKYLPQPSFTF